MAARRGALRRGRAYRPPTEWEGFAATGDSTVLGATKVLLGRFTVTGAPVTIRRTRGIVNWRSDQVVASETALGAFGLCVVSNDAFDVGATAIPGPSSDASSELWFVHQFLYARFELLSSSGFHPDGSSEYMIDSKAMRKVSEEESIVVMVEATGADGGIFAAQFRILASASRA